MSQITVAASRAAIEQMLFVLRDNFTYSNSDGDSFGPFSASYALAIHLEGGSLNFDVNLIEIQNVDLVFDTLTAEVCFDLPGFSIPGFCIIPDPWNGCLVGIPDITIGGPICVPLDLSGLTTEVNFIKGTPATRYFVDPGRDPAWSDLRAEFEGTPNKWQVYMDNIQVSVDLIDVPATIANVFENFVENFIEEQIEDFVPGFLVDVVMALVDPIVDLVSEALGLVDTIEDFIQDLFNLHFGFEDIIASAVIDYFANENPIEFEDPYPIIKDGPLIPVKIPIVNLHVAVNNDELIIEGDIG